MLLLAQNLCLSASSRYGSRVWQADDGLPQNNVLALALSGDGYLWAGTQAGLVRFNGIEFVPLKHKEAPHLDTSKISALCRAMDGSLWVGCEGVGLSVLRDSHCTTIALSNGLPSLEIKCLMEAPGGGMWVGTEAGLTFINGGALLTYTISDGLGDNSVRALALDAFGNLNIATKRGLTTMSPSGVFSTRVFPGRWNANALRALHKDGLGRLWVGATDGLYLLNGTNQITYGVAEGLPDRIINSVFSDRQGTVWIGTYGGLARVVSGGISRVSDVDSMASELISTIVQDPERNLWIGTRDGLLRLSPSRFKTYTTVDGLTGNNVMSVLEDSKSSIWMGIWGGGLNAMRFGETRVFRDAGDLARDSVLSLMESRGGALWVGMDFDLGLNIITNDTRVALPGLVPGGPIRVLHEDSRGDIWVGTDQGLVILKSSGQKEAFSSTNGLAGNQVRVIKEQPSGAVWVGTDHGLTVFQNREARTPQKLKGLPFEAISALHFDSEGVMWMGTLGGGLLACKDGVFHSWQSKDGLYSNEIYEILEDDEGVFWMSCRKGLFRVPKKHLWSFRFGRTRRVSATVFGKADGLLSVQFNGVSKPAGWKDRSGKLWFASIRGVVRVDPAVPINQRAPPVVIERIDAGRVTVWPPDNSAQAPPLSVTVPAGLDDVEFHYAALSLSSPEKNRFSYKLDGADSGWTAAGSQRLARYNKLAPGKYVFRVTGCNNDGVWNETGASATITVLPRFWQTVWFRLLMAVVVGGVVWLTYRVRMSRLRGLEALRMRIAANLHDDVGARLTKVAMITEHVNHQIAPGQIMKPGIEAIARATGDVTRAMDEVVWTINPKNDTLENLANYMFHYSQEYFQNTSIRCLLDFPPALPEKEIPTEARHNLFMALKEALNNVLKHSQASEARIRFEAGEKELRIQIEDNGRGFDLKQAQKSGDGLSNMRRRARSVKGRVEWKTARGKGTVVCIEAPWP